MKKFRSLKQMSSEIVPFVKPVDILEKSFEEITTVTTTVKKPITLKTKGKPSVILSTPILDTIRSDYQTKKFTPL